MMLKTSLLGWLLNGQVLLSLLGICLPRRWGATLSWLLVLPVALGAIIVRGLAVGHPPMSNLFEAFLWITPCLVLLTLLDKWRVGVWRVRMDASLGFLVAFPLAFVFSDRAQLLPPALQSVLFVPHVFGYMLAYALMARAFVLECCSATRDARKNAATGFFLITVALVLGSIWGNEAWGGYWRFDPKEQWSLATWLIYAAYFHASGTHKLRLLWLGLGLLAIILTVTWINLSKLFPGLHSYAGF